MSREIIIMPSYNYHDAKESTDCKTLDNYILLVNTLRVKVTTIEQSLSMQRLLSKATLESFTVKCVYTLMTSH